jgi:hypothetical protein
LAICKRLEAKNNWLKNMGRIKEGILRRTRYKWEKVEVTLILSTGRTGTNFLAKFFNDNFDGVDGRHEPQMDLYKVGIDYICGLADKEESVSSFYNLRYQILKDLIDGNKQFYVESNFNLSVIVDLAEKVYPNLKIVHVVRDPKTCIKSYYNKSPNDSGTSYFMDDNDNYRQRLLPQFFPEDNFHKQAETLNRFQKVCWHWRKYNESAMELSKKLNLPYQLVKFEDVFIKKDLQILEQLIEFMNLADKKKAEVDFFEKLGERANYSRHGELIGKYDTWTDQQKSQFHEIVDDVALKLGY